MDDLFYLSIDPGERTTGWAAFREDGTDIDFGKVRGTLDDFMDWLEGLRNPPKHIIYENYMVNPTISHGFSKVPTIQLIGMIKRYAKKAGIELHEQRNVILKVALRHVGFYNIYYDSKGKKKKHVDDAVSAYAHGVYWLQKNKIRKPRIANG